MQMEDLCNKFWFCCPEMCVLQSGVQAVCVLRCLCPTDDQPLSITVTHLMSTKAPAAGRAAPGELAHQPLQCSHIIPGCRRLRPAPLPSQALLVLLSDVQLI